ncbi:MAG TPA: hypothetical protein VJ914_19345 [Pseudonocardiaceae bacterium]|nr:hypothetical protein [Pseudonocardiaceae bacterium]
MRLLAILVVAIAITGCTGTQGPGSSSGPDQACAAALKAERNLQAHQGTDQSDESAIDQDFMNFADALNSAAQHEADPAKAKAMTALAEDYAALVGSQSGAAQLPDMNTVSSDGAAFDKSCG